MNRLLLVGDFTGDRMRTEIFIQRAFEKIGWTVDTYSYRMQALASSARNMNILLGVKVQETKPDLVLICGGDYIDPRMVAKIRELGPKVVNWYFDHPKGGLSLHVDRQFDSHQHPDPWLLALCRECDASFFTGGHDKVLAKEVMAAGGRPFALLQGCDPDEHGKRAGGIKKEVDVLFLGELPDERWYRRKVVDALASDAKMGFYGEDRQKLFASARINLNVQFNNNVEKALSCRVFNSMAAGVFSLHHHVPGIEELFEKPGQYCDWFKTLDEGREKIEYWLSHDKEREHAAQRGRDFVLKHHTYQARIETMLECLAGVKGAKRSKPKPKTEQPFTICMMSPDNEYAELGKVLNKRKLTTVQWDIPTPETDVMVVAHPDHFLPAVVYKSIYRSTPLVVILWEIRPWEIEHPDYVQYYAYIRHGLSLADKVICPTQYTADLAEQYLGVTAEVVRMWDTGPKKVVNIPADFVVSIGDFRRHKRHEVLIRALAELGPNAPKARIVGRIDDGTLEWYQDLAKFLGVEDKVQFIENATTKDWRDALASAMFLVAPGDQEGLIGANVISALKSGIPVLAAESPALEEFLDAGIGDEVTSFKANSPADLAEKMLAWMVKTPKVNPGKTTTFTVSKAATRIMKVLTRVVDGG